MTQKGFRRDIGLFSVLVTKSNVVETHNYRPEGTWNETADAVELNFAECGLSVLRTSSALDRGVLWEKCTSHFRGDQSNANLLCRTLNSANQLSIFGAVADWCVLNWLSRFLVGHFQALRSQLRKGTNS